MHAAAHAGHNARSTRWLETTTAEPAMRAAGTAIEIGGRVEGVHQPDVLFPDISGDAHGALDAGYRGHGKVHDRHSGRPQVVRAQPAGRKQPTRGSNRDRSSALAISAICRSLPPRFSSRTISRTA